MTRCMNTEPIETNSVWMWTANISQQIIMLCANRPVSFVSKKLREILLLEVSCVSYYAHDHVLTNAVKQLVTFPLVG